jgi:hypothetical protein
MLHAQVADLLLHPKLAAMLNHLLYPEENPDLSADLSEQGRKQMGLHFALSAFVSTQRGWHQVRGGEERRRRRGEAERRRRGGERRRAKRRGGEELRINI